MEPSKICHASALTQEAKLFTNQCLNSEEFVVSAKVVSALFSSFQGHHVSNCMFENAAGGAGSSNLHVPNQDHEVLDGSPAIVAADTDDDNPAGQVMSLPIMGRRLFHSPTLTRYGSEPPKWSRVGSSNKASRKNCKPRFKVTFNMDFNREKTMLFNYLFSEGHPMEDTLVRMRECRLTRRHIETLIPGRPIDGRVVEMVAMRNTCSIQHLNHPYFWCLPPRFAEDVSKGLLVDELAETYLPFWVKPSRFLNRIFIPVKEIFFHWYCVVVDFADKMVYHLDSYPNSNKIADRESLIRNMVERLHDLMTYPDYGPLRAFTPTDLREWPIKQGQGIPNCNTSAAAWVISWLDLEGRFNALEISGVLDDSTLKGRTAVSLAGGPFNAIGSLVRMWAKQWQRLGISRK
ncbi:Ulp1 protease family, carboxy-terminal domain protein [Arachis hypogaea]|nr:Ulp1 protease family, carboxy-terminal domain protein [Arachis hypogaea]